MLFGEECRALFVGVLKGWATGLYVRLAAIIVEMMSVDYSPRLRGCYYTSNSQSREFYNKSKMSNYELTLFSRSNGDD
jgi:hypothetical protein